MSKQRRNPYVPLIALFILVIVSLACGSSAPTSTPTVSTATVQGFDTQPFTGSTEAGIPTEDLASVDTPVSPATETPVTELFLGDAVANFGYALTAVAVQDPAIPGMLYDVTSGKKLIAVEVIISNLSGDMIGVNALNATLVDTDGFTYKTELGGVDDQISTVDLNPGEKVQGFIAFEVPETAVAARIKYALDFFGSNILQVSLTPAPLGHVAIMEPPSTPVEPLPNLGDVVENFGYLLTAVAVEDPAMPGRLYRAKPGYKLVAIEIVLGNVSGSEVLNVNPLYAYLVDNNGFVYSVELGGRDDQIDTGELATGERVKGWVAFTIPENAAPASIKFSTTPFGGNYLQTGLSR